MEALALKLDQRPLGGAGRGLKTRRHGTAGEGATGLRDAPRPIRRKASKYQGVESIEGSAHRTELQKST